MIKTIEDVDKAVESMLEYVLTNKKIIIELKQEKNHKQRWIALEKFLIKNLAECNVSFEDYNNLTYGIRDSFFYKMQQESNLDFGFCSYFKPAWRQLAIYFLSGQKTNPEKNWNLCYFDGKNKPVETTCVGTDRNICGFLYPDLKKK